MLCCGHTLTDFPISIRLTSLALWQSNYCPSASKATLMNMDKYFMWIHYERLHNHNIAKHNKTVCIFLGIYCNFRSYQLCLESWYSLPRVIMMPNLVARSAPDMTISGDHEVDIMSRVTIAICVYLFSPFVFILYSLFDYFVCFPANNYELDLYSTPSITEPCANMCVYTSNTHITPWWFCEPIISTLLSCYLSLVNNNFVFLVTFLYLV